MIAIIIYGTRGVTYNHEGGSFHCPECGEATYKHKRVRRFFTLYFIPLIPLDLLGEYVECGGCRGTYKIEVLSYDPRQEAAAHEAEYHHAIRKVMVLMMLADGIIDDNEVSTICGIYEAITKKPLSEEQVRAEAQEQEGMSVQAVIQPLVGVLNDSGKELVIRAALQVALSDDDFADEEKVLLGEIASALQLSTAHFRGIMAELTSSAEERAEANV